MSILISNIEGKTNHTHNYSTISHTNFLDPYEVAQIKHLLKHEKHLLWGGHDRAERHVLFVLPDYIDEPPVNEYIRLLRLSTKNAAGLGHRDYLGSLTGLGIKREKLGDISVCDDGADVLVMADIAQYISQQADKVARANMDCEILDVEQFRPPVKNTTIQKIFVASMRLDVLLAAVYNLSRADAQKFIIAEKVFVDWQSCTNTSKQISEGSTLSLKGMGRFTVLAATGSTKKGRIVLEIEKY